MDAPRRAEDVERLGEAVVVDQARVDGEDAQEEDEVASVEEGVPDLATEGDCQWALNQTPGTCVTGCLQHHWDSHCKAHGHPTQRGHATRQASKRSKQTGHTHPDFPELLRVIQKSPRMVAVTVETKHYKLHIL